MKLPNAALTVPVLLLVMICLFFVGGSLADKPTFRIIAPEFICNPVDGSHSSIPDNSSAVEENARGTSTHSARQLTIGFQTNGGQRLHYRVKTYFTLLGDTGFISQRHTVGLWRAVRQLEQRIRRERDVIAQRGQMTIGTDELLPGVVYSFGVVAVDADGVESDEQNFTMTYRNVDQGASFEHAGSSRGGNDVSLLMLGAEKTYADVDYLVTAQLIFCHPRTDYYYRWTVGGMNDSEPIAVAMERSKMLTVPAGSLLPEKLYHIEVTVYSTSTVDEVLARAHMTVTVLRRVPSVVLFPVDAVVGIDQTIRVRSYTSSGAVVQWSCQKANDGGRCDDTFDTSEDDAMVTFYKEGQYIVKASIVGSSSESSLLVHPKVTPTVRLLQMSQYPAVAGQPFELLVSVAGLVPNCYSNWTVVKGEDGFEHFDPTQLPNGGNLGGLFIRDVEENFLSELVDYGNDTVVKDVSLSIPGDTREGSWKGLAPNVRYKLRLETVCPELIDDSKRQVVRASVHSHWTFVLETNGAPEGSPIVLSPEANGTALVTVYKLSTGIAKDTEQDYPLRYSFWYVADSVDVQIATYYEMTSAETILPYTKTGSVATYVIVCDSRNACSKIDGPDVYVLPGVEPSAETVSNVLGSVEAFFDRLNFRDALKNAFELLITLRNRNSPQYDGAYRRFVDLLQQSISHIRRVYSETTYLSEASVQEFVLQAKSILDLEESSNHELFQQLLELMDPSPRPKRAASTSLPPPRPVFSPESISKVNTKLLLMESLTVSKNVSVARQARTNLLSSVHQATKNYCALESHHIFVGQLITLEMNRYRSLSELNFGHIPVPNKVLLSSPVGRGQFLDAFPETEYFCLGRVYYARDLFVERETHELDMGFYEAFVLSVEKGGMWTLVDWRNDYFLWSLDGRRLPNVTCQMWDNSAWSSKDCITVETVSDEVRCNCTQLGYLRISNETELTPPEDSSGYSSPKPTTNSSPSSADLQPASTIVPESGSSADATKVVSALVTTTQPSAEPVASTATQAVTVTESDMVTLGTEPNNATEATENFPVGPSPNTSITDNGPSALLQGGNENGTSTLQSRSLAVSSIKYTIVGALAIALLALAVIGVVYRRRKAVLRLADELHSVPSRARTQPSPHVRYARFQDEHNMAGDNVSTISDVLTI
uniref:GPS domain-containing protein n=1 Tax=Anopheles epiroticus TaxID=199890 RepID=A0A182PAK7_9DIPT